MSEQPNHQDGKGIKVLLIITALIYGVSFMPAGSDFENLKSNVRSMSGPQSMRLDGGTEFFNAFSNSFTEIQAGYGAFVKIFNPKSGNKMILEAAVKSYKEPYHSTSSWETGKMTGMFLRLSVLIGLIFWVKKL